MKYLSFEKYITDVFNQIVSLTTVVQPNQTSYMFNSEINYFTYYKNSNELWINYREIYLGFIDECGIFDKKILRKIIRDKIKEYLKLNKITILRNSNF